MGLTPPPRKRPRRYWPSPAVITVAVAGVLGFGCTLRYTQQSNLGGEYTCSGFDLAPVLLGVVTGIAGAVALLTGWRKPSVRLVEIPAGVLGIGLGVVHVLRGVFDIFGELC